MKIKIGELHIEVISVIVENDKLRIQLNETTDTYSFVSQLSNTTMVYTDDDDNIIRTFEGVFELNSVEQSNGFTYCNIQVHPVKDNSDLLGLIESITNIEIALCEIYESLGV